MGSFPWPPTRRLADELRETTTRLDGLDAGKIPLNVRTVFAASCLALPDDLATLFGLLGLTPGPDISLAATGALMEQPITQVRTSLRELEMAHLVIQPVPARYRQHNLLRLYAADQVRHDHSADVLNTALRRLVDFYLHAAHDAHQILAPHHGPMEIDLPHPNYHPCPIADQTAALEWFDVEHPCLLATQHLAYKHGWYDAVWQLAWALNTFQRRRGHMHDRFATWQIALAAARHDSNPATLAVAHQRLGRASYRLGKHTEALNHLNDALNIANATGDALTKADTHRALSAAWGYHGNSQLALDHATNALRLLDPLDEPMRKAELLNTIGRHSAQLGHHQHARNHCNAALALARSHHSPSREASVLNTLGYLAHHTGQLTQALDYYHQALNLLRNLGYTYQQANTLNHLGQTYATLGDLNRAQTVWQQALHLYRTQHRLAEAKNVQRQLEELDPHPTNTHAPECKDN